MKVIILLLFISFHSLCTAQPKIAIDSVGSYIGQKVKVCSEVYGIKSTDKITFINLAKAYPHSPLTIVIFARDRAKFPDTPEKLYGNMPVCVTGMLKEYKGKTEIVVTSPDQITPDR